MAVLRHEGCLFIKNPEETKEVFRTLRRKKMDSTWKDLFALERNERDSGQEERILAFMVQRIQSCALYWLENYYTSKIVLIQESQEVPRNQMRRNLGFSTKFPKKDVLGTSLI
ncbi:hypothetical protein AVEN_195515-1 [Araneus ventricosus]|uniref:Uncharacterized protein n=1 Tax=Araneus ventricosus TaxID=182803 RepID=A0A4Y2IZ09_ARAVE|nr:hypothetical protein AVEN_195515-1 [Araneus ventricosus]